MKNTSISSGSEFDLESISMYFLKCLLFCMINITFRSIISNRNAIHRTMTICNLSMGIQTNNNDLLWVVEIVGVLLPIVSAPPKAPVRVLSVDFNPRLTKSTVGK
ncbi:hypothetical protein ECANGB1_171 [Enterospora canceri]|uniref:Uncharacterized protein n=1 Tax=Enterospora canceri TaxID=1081671 RepID=A0A1Y1S4L6_9MICR|nr:hypothetical protein ECANGB1_171 [Enterospora canceri]